MQHLGPDLFLGLLTEEGTSQGLCRSTAYDSRLLPPML